MSENNRNFFLAIGLSLGVLLLWQIFVAEPALEEQRRQQQTEQGQGTAQGDSAGGEVDDVPRVDTGDMPVPATGEAPSESADASAGTELPPARLPREAAIARTERVQVETPALTGSVNLVGARIDDLRLKRYQTTLEDGAPIITLLSPREAEGAYFANFGWTAERGSTVSLPDQNTRWTPTSQGPLTPESPLTLFWDNGEGLRFTRTITVDGDYMFTVTEKVTNSTGTPLTLFPFGAIVRFGTPSSQSLWIQHEGLTGFMDGSLKQETFRGIKDTDTGRNVIDYRSTGGWMGITDKYWMTALVPPQDETFGSRYIYRTRSGKDQYQVDYLLDGRQVPAGGSVEVTTNLFAGAKKVELIDQYRDELEILRFDLAIDWGWFWFFTKPFFYALHFFANATGNYGVAILLLTVIVKAVFFPLANKSYESMSKMKKVQPDMMKLRERYKDDKVKQQQELLALYQREKINPMMGCLPILIQIPVFFALYKVLYISLEIRHEPFFGWIQDLSAPDPTTIFNLFGLLPYDPGALPILGAFLMVGVWPVIMGITMWLQMQMNPAPTDDIQKQVFAVMPFLFTFLLATFSAGLVIYWTWNNILSIAQQYIIMRRMGVEPEWKNNIGIPGFVKRALGRAPAKPSGEKTTSTKADKDQPAEENSSGDGR